MIATAALSWSDKIGLAVAVIGAVGSAVAACIAAWRTGQVHAAIRPPSNGVTIGTLAENNAVVQKLATHLLADLAGKDVTLPTPAQTQAQLPGSTLNSPPPAPTDTQSPPPPSPPAP